MSIQQEQFCQLTDRFFKDMDKAITSRNDIRVNIVHQERQENLDALIPSGKINNWIFKVVKINKLKMVLQSLHAKVLLVQVKFIPNQHGVKKVIKNGVQQSQEMIGDLEN